MAQYAKLTNGIIELSPKLITYNDEKIINPPEVILRELGYKELIYVPMPQPIEGYYWESKWVEDETTITQVWDKKELPTPEQSPQDYLYQLLFGTN